MPITPQNQPAVNAVLIRNLTVVTAVAGGRLVTRAALKLGGANVAEDGGYTDLGLSSAMTVNDLNNLPDDLASLAPQVAAVEAALISLVDGLNAIRKLI